MHACWSTPEDTEPPQVEVAHEAVFKAWPRLERWIEKNAGRLRLLRSLDQSAKDWKDAGSPKFSQLPDRATLKRYKEVQSRGTETAKLYCKAGWTLQRVWQFGIGGLLLAFLLLGVDGWLTTQERTWNTLRIWGLAKMGLYQGPEMIKIRPGPDGFPSFDMGSAEEGYYPPPVPVHPVQLKKPFAIGRYEITFDEYGAYTFDKGLEQPDDRDWGVGDRPVINVSWDDLEKYIEWLNEVTKRNPMSAFAFPRRRSGSTRRGQARRHRTGGGDDVQQDGKVWGKLQGLRQRLGR